MRLSEEILLGDTLRERNFTWWLNKDSTCGCAIGGAALARGWQGKGLLTPTVICGLWPWLRQRDLMVISRKFRKVCIGEMTIEQLADYVRSIEPDCDCCRFDCDCRQAQVLRAGVKNEVTTRTHAVGRQQ